MEAGPGDVVSFSIKPFRVFANIGSPGARARLSLVGLGRRPRLRHLDPARLRAGARLRLGSAGNSALVDTVKALGPRPHAANVASDGRVVSPHDASGPEVAFAYRGSAKVEVEGEAVRLGEGDTMTVPIGPGRRFTSEAGALLFMVWGA